MTTSETTVTGSGGAPREIAPVRLSYAAIGGLFLAVAFYFVSRYSYPVYHTIVELFCMVVAGTIFVIAWNCRSLFERDYVLVIGLAMLGFTVLGVPHMLAYRGFDLFPGFDANLPTQIYLIQRYLIAAAFVIAPAFYYRRLPTKWAVVVLSAVVLLAFTSTMWWRNFPDAFVPGTGLTTFKVMSEYIIAVMFGIGALFLWLKRDAVDRSVLVLALAALGSFILSEVMFTLYGTPFGTTNFLGHLSQTAAFTLLYLAVVRTALVRPYSLLFRELASSEERYRDMAETLQAGMLHVPKCIEGLTVAHEYHAASDTARIGGDFYDVFCLSDGRVGVLLGDVSGKGLEAATIAAQVKSVMRSMAEVDPTPAFLLGHANDLLRRDLGDGQFVTATYALIDPASGEIWQCSAGHPDPVLCGDKYCALEELPRNPPLGAVEGIEYECVGRTIMPGQVLVLYSDGISEARDAGEFFGDERVRESLAAHADAEPAELVSVLVDSARGFAQGHFTDDVAVLAVRMEPREIEG